MATSPLVFISHSSLDSKVAEALVRLLRAAFNLSPQEIRCTSVEGYRLPAGADTDEQLRNEILSAEALLGIVSRQAMASAYVLFELGARWGAKKYLVPLLAPGVEPGALKGPVAGLNALRCDSEDQLHQLVYDLSKHLSRQANSPASYLTELQGVLSARSVEPAPESVMQTQPTKDFELDKDHLSLVQAFAQIDEGSLYLGKLASHLNWSRIRTEHVVDVLLENNYMEVSGGMHGAVYDLSKKGRALAVKSGFTKRPTKR